MPSRWSCRPSRSFHGDATIRRRSSGTWVCALLAFIASTGTAFAEGRPAIALISPWIDHHDRIEEHLRRLDPPVAVERFDLERHGKQKRGSWAPAFGFPDVVDLDRRLVILENAPLEALRALRTPDGVPLDRALVEWVSRGGVLLIVGGAPAIDDYAGSALERLMGFLPKGDARSFLRATRREIRTRAGETAFVNHVHRGAVGAAQVVLEAGGEPFLLERSLGAGSVTTVLSGAQGALRRDGGEPSDEWFSSSAWADELLRLTRRAYAETGFAPTLGPVRPLPVIPVPPRDGFDIRYFQIVNRPHPFGLAPGEAYDLARSLRERGFTSAVFGTTSGRPLDDRRALEEIARAGLRIVYYDGVRPNSPEARFWKGRALPSRARTHGGKDLGWDVHAPEFRDAASRLLEGRSVDGLPLRAVQLIEEFRDEAVGPALIAPAFERDANARFDRLRRRGAETAKTFRAFRRAGQRLFPDVPQSTYWPGSYWARPHHYAYSLASLAGVVDEVLGPGYGYVSSQRDLGPESVRWSANGGWSALRFSKSERPHLAIYAMGRPLSERGDRAPSLDTWRETAWTALGHGATGLAYWALPRGDLGAPLADLHEEMGRLGPWLAAPTRTSAPVALVASWTSRTASRDDKAARAYNACLKDVHRALELGFEDVDLVLEEQLATLTSATRALVLVGAPRLSPDAARALEGFLRRGGVLFVDRDSARLVFPGDRSLDLSAAGRVERLPAAGGCTGARLSPRRLASVLDEVLREAGVKPRVYTEGLDTSASIRGDEELMHIYFMNHSGGPDGSPVRWGAPPPGGAHRKWVELRTGTRDVAEGSLLAGEPIASGSARVWASVARPAASWTIEADPGEPTALRIRARDRDDRPVADGYPLRVEIERPCGRFIARSVVLKGGVFRLEDAACPGADGESLSWGITDPMTGTRASQESAPESLDPSRR